MQISIEFCMQWNYGPRAASLAVVIEKALDIKPTLIEGGGGIYEIKVDGDLLFSKHDVGRYPTDDEILDGIRAKFQ